MSNRYFKGEKVLLYTKFYDENGNIPDNIDNARVRILHENNGKIYQDMNWTELKNIGEIKGGQGYEKIIFHHTVFFACILCGNGTTCAYDKAC